MRIGNIEVSDWSLYEGETYCLKFTAHSKNKLEQYLSVINVSDLNTNMYSLWFGENWIYQLYCNVCPKEKVFEPFTTIEDAKRSVDYNLKKLQNLAMFL